MRRGTSRVVPRGTGDGIIPATQPPQPGGRCGGRTARATKSRRRAGDLGPGVRSPTFASRAPAVGEDSEPRYGGSVPFRDPARALALVSIAVGLVLAAGLGAAWAVYDSQLALAQAADSLVDASTASALWWAVGISRQPPDEDHPVGHHAAEPLGALLVAVFAGALAVEVATQAVDALVADARPRLSPVLAAAFAAKLVAKVFVSRAALGYHRTDPSPALRAIGVDSRNDVLVGGIALIGFVAARYGSPAVDAWLALPLAVWIGLSAVMLGIENVRLLMGEAASPARCAALEALADGVPGVRRAHSLRAHHRGRGLMVWVQVAVDPELTVARGHDIGEAVEAVLRREADVIEAFAHVDVD